MCPLFTARLLDQSGPNLAWTPLGTWVALQAGQILSTPPRGVVKFYLPIVKPVGQTRSDPTSEAVIKVESFCRPRKSREVCEN